MPEPHVIRQACDQSAASLLQTATAVMPSGRKPPAPVPDLIPEMHPVSCRYRRSPTTKARQL